MESFKASLWLPHEILKGKATGHYYWFWFKCCSHFETTIRCIL